jgi:hypothetical protein
MRSLQMGSRWGADGEQMGSRWGADGEQMGSLQMGSLNKKVTSEMQECLDAKADTENHCGDDPVSTPLENEQDDIDDSEPDEVYDDLESDDSDDDFVPPDLA